MLLNIKDSSSLDLSFRLMALSFGNLNMAAGSFYWDRVAKEQDFLYSLGVFPVYFLKVFP